ncbi:F-box protein At4g00755-like isoform X2 [Juglans microcarpa x Juglans regia]|uniref:F-box protein At4g00755-like isoform X2 n=1 Tax=Juglans microcarpa x Juglans regia TaxID=2249226 RepID=UPI001B7DE7C2|nr:F-box protein At4g00755-like isoform X2 [Juglans microcarpa x Juglans regia]XP_041008245.1 F-box protein At4g00755-like isoform X2 [Juglans microcarpa x Juglans regia]
MRRMDNRGDFLQLLGPDVSTAILNHLDDPSDLVRACSVSRSWHRFVIENGICKQLFLKMFPEIYNEAHIIELNNNMIGPTKLNGDNSSEWERLKRDHRVYAFLARGLSPSIRTDCLSEPISASSTDNYPDESIRNTLEPGDRVENRASYWSSEGENDPNVPETLTYTLVANLCVVTEIRVQPFQAFFQYGFPIYSSKAVRFRMGYPRRPLEFNNDKLASHEWGDEIIWTYTSPEFPMAQENFLQAFKLPEPVLCIGGILQVELLGRVQRQEMDELYYICVSHVQVLGRPLLQPFDIEVLDPSGLCALNYNLKTQCYESSTQSHETEAAAHVRRFTDILMQLLGNGAVVADHESDEEPPA